MASLNDLSLVTQVAVLGNKRAFDQLVRKYQSPVRRFLLNLTLGNEALSDDLAQDAFIKAYLSIRQFRGQSSFQTWVMRIAYNVFYDHTRKSQTSREETLESALPAISQQPGSSSLRFDLYTALATLRPEERTCITLQLVDGYDIRQIAEITGLKEGTVKSHLSRGKERLANYLKQNGYDRR